MKYLLKNIAYAIMLLTVFNCATEPVDNDILELSNTTFSIASTLETTTPCTGDSPQARVINNSSVDVEFMVYDDNAVKVVEESGIGISVTSSWHTIPSGEITIVVVNNTGGDKIVIQDVDTCMNFQFEIDANNNITYTVSTSG